MTWLAVTDVLGAILLVGLAVTGAILHWWLPPHSAHDGPGHPPETVMGMTRHGWGDIHFVESIAFLLVIAVHLYQHRLWIRAQFRRRPGQESAQ